MATLTLNPLFPIPNRETRIVLSGSVSGTNYFRVWVTVAPSNSKLDNDIRDTKDPRNRVELYSDSGGEDFPLIIRFDKGGKYTFIVQEYIKGSGYGGAYQGDPGGSDNEAKNGSESTLYVYIGQRLTQPIGPSDQRATLNLWVWNDSVKATYKSIHGEDTPSITASNQTDRIKSAIESPSVKTALLNLVDQSASYILGDIPSFAASYFSVWNAHVINNTYHSVADTFNTLDSSLATAYSFGTLKDLVNSAISKQKMHFNDDNSLDSTVVPPTPVGPGRGGFHDSSDRPNNSLYSSVSSIDDSIGALADLYRCYELHRSDASVHSPIDTVNALPALPLLLLVHKEFLSVIASTNPTPPAAQSTGAQILISGAGFKE